jgi:predicted nucleotidyltransferase
MDQGKLDQAFIKDNGFYWSTSRFMLCKAGSMTHGTDVYGSDVDYYGVVVPPTRMLLGLQGFDHWEPEHLGMDVKIHSLRKYVGLLLKNNPNILETLWLRNSSYEFVSDGFDLLRSFRNEFSSLRAAYSFMGYANDQLKRLETSKYSRRMGEKRKALVDQFGYDPKNASHLIRLFRSGVEFVETGILTVYRPDAAELVRIKKGDWSLSQVKAEAAQLESRMRDAITRSPLPKEPNREWADNFLVIRHILHITDGETS